MDPLRPPPCSAAVTTWLPTLPWPDRCSDGGDWPQLTVTVAAMAAAAAAGNAQTYARVIPPRPMPLPRQAGRAEQ